MHYEMFSCNCIDYILYLFQGVGKKKFSDTHGGSADLGLNVYLLLLIIK